MKIKRKNKSFWYLHRVLYYNLGDLYVTYRFNVNLIHSMSIIQVQFMEE